MLYFDRLRRIPMSKTYNITRQTAAKQLWVSTRTIDRYIKNGKLSYKKIANKVIVAQEEIDLLGKDFAALRQESTTELVSNSKTSRTLSTQHDTSLDAIDQKIDKFFLVFKEKDKMIEDKNKVIFMLQQRVGELETKIQHMIALPDYNKEKQAAMIEKEKLEYKLTELQGWLKSEKLKNIIYLGLSLLFIFIAILFMTQS
jgi:excisionase family DNA binding protein